MRTRSKIFPLVLGLLLFTSPGFSKAQKPQPTKRYQRYSLSRGEPIEIPARKAILPFVIYGDEMKGATAYVPSGYIGDASALSVSPIYESAPLASGKPGRTALKITYFPKGSEGWAGIFWLTPPNNWGTVKGAGYDLSQAKRLTFWVRGEKGGEIITEVKLGGIAGGPYPDSDMASLGPLELSTDWDQYAIDLSGKDLRHIIAGFAFVVRRADNPRGAVFYFDEIVFEGEAPSPAATPTTPEKSP
ncbi:MAG: hypothetical protein LHV69_03290 [Elusimicrobia bacterium]|nr:hypothetical protein [Candidatus Obscuribacterium magneticum]